MNAGIRRLVWTALLVPWLTGGTCVAPEEQCADAIDNNGDGLIDCDDPECHDDYYDTYYCENEETDCSDGLDNDFDGDEDCDDSDCEDVAECEVDGDGGTSSGGSSSGGSGTGGDGGATGGDTSDGGANGGLGGDGLGGGAGEGSGGGFAFCPTPEPIGVTSGYVGIGTLDEFSDFTESSCQTVAGKGDLPLVFVAEADGILTVRGYATYADVDVSLRSSCADPSSELPLGCAADGTSGMQEEVVVEVEANETVYIIASAESDMPEETIYLSVALD